MALIDDTDPRAEAVRLMAIALREHFGERAHDLARRMFEGRADETWRLILEELKE
ncbi:hypothetical protein [Sphingomonas sp.]|uniref:hypothetical protein n=1 Tax=Sphingomonas sp. TaxID=28214 RepID=UPI003B00DC0E